MNTNDTKTKKPAKSTEEKQEVTFDAEISANLVKQDGKIKTTTKITGKTVDILVLTYAVIANFAEQTGLPIEAVLSLLLKVSSRIETVDEETKETTALEKLLKDFLTFIALGK